MILKASLLALSIASEFTAYKSGNFAKFNQCFLSKDAGRIEITMGPNSIITQSTQINESLQEMLELAQPAIIGIGRQFHRWSANQIEYSVLSKTFFAEGFLNVVNNSEASDRLRTLMDEYCDEKLIDFKILGDFQLELEIGGRVFLDNLTIKRQKDRFSSAKIIGEYSVPRSFTTALQSLNYKDGAFSFIIRVQEGEEDYLSLFEGKLTSDTTLKGKAFILPGRQLLGEFIGRRL